MHCARTCHENTEHSPPQHVQHTCAYIPANALIANVREILCVLFSRYWFEYFWPNYAVPFVLNLDNINSFKWQEKVNCTLNNTKLYIFKNV